LIVLGCNKNEYFKREEFAERIGEDCTDGSVIFMGKLILNLNDKSKFFM
jgi:hypothetical protein